jgi:hypothetical protein
MFELYVKEVKKGKRLRDFTVVDSREGVNRTRKILDSLEKACYSLDISVPIWLKSNENEFKKYAMTRFTQDSFIDEVPFDFLEIKVVEEDY